MLRYLNTDNGMIVEVPEWKAVRYDHACNMRRLEDSPQPSPPPHGDLWADKQLKKSSRRKKVSR